MKTVSKLSLMLALLSLASCNEKVSPELQSGNSSNGSTSTTSGSGSGGPTITPPEYYFSVTNTSPLILNYKLHQTGLGNATKACEVRSTTKLSNDAFRGAPALNDITCYFEAEELSLHHSGFNIQINASPNTCEFVGYMPYGFYDKMPGDSTGTYIQVTCANDTTNSTNVLDSVAVGDTLIDYAGGGKLGCNEWASQDILTTDRNKFSPASDEELCAFNYRDGDSCDVGTITINEYIVTYTPPADTTPAVLKAETVTRRVNCGGQVANCVKGPTKTIDATLPRVTEITNTNYDEVFAKEYKNEGLIGKKANNMTYANFRRDLANYQIDYGSGSGLPGSYTSAFADPTFSKVFDPRVLDYYSNNKNPDGTKMVTDAMVTQFTNVNNTYMRKPLAADPIVGLAGKVNPFYTFYCFDTAFDMKARIRVVVRDWDRVFSTNSDLELISDIYKGSSAHQDIQNYVELPGDNDPWIPFNDLYDMDDWISMDRTIGTYDPFITRFNPTPTIPYPLGWFNPDYFPAGAH